MTDDSLVICRCEEVTLADVLDAIRRGARDVDAVKRMTRAGMGLCQGKTCGRLVAAAIARETDRPVSDVRPMTQRIPVRPVPACALARQPLPEPCREGRCGKGR